MWMLYLRPRVRCSFRIFLIKLFDKIDFLCKLGFEKVFKWVVIGTFFREFLWFRG